MLCSKNEHGNFSFFTPFPLKKIKKPTEQPTRPLFFMKFICNLCGYNGKSMRCPHCDNLTRIVFDNDFEREAVYYFVKYFRTKQKMRTFPEEYDRILSILVDLGAVYINSDQLFEPIYKNGDSPFWTIMTIDDYLNGDHIGCSL